MLCVCEIDGETNPPMKRFLAPVLLMTFLSPSLAISGEVTMDNLIFRSSNGLHYKKFTEVPFTGKVTGIGQGSFSDGKRDGPHVLYHKNGQVSTKETYKNGERDGPWVTYHDNGQVLTCPLS